MMSQKQFCLYGLSDSRASGRGIAAVWVSSLP